MQTIEFNGEGYSATISQEDGKFVLAWNDGVANEWREEFNLLSVAVSRLAMLQWCAEDQFESGFGRDANAFGADAALFMMNQTRAPTGPKIGQPPLVKEV